MTRSRIRPLPPERATEVTALFVDAFRDYPVMRYVLGPGPDYDERLPLLIGLFVAGRALRGEPMLGIEDPDGTLVGAATMSRPGAEPPAPFLTLRESVWSTLGGAARERYERYGATADRFRVEAPHHHLNMIGIRRTHAGRGLSRPLLEAAHRLTRDDPAATGVTLNTENPANVSYYEHFGYRVLGHATVAPGFETWAFFRPR